MIERYLRTFTIKILFFIFIKPPLFMRFGRHSTTFSYRIGKIDGKNIAVIGIPNPDSPVSRIQFKSEGYKITHSYEKMTEEEAKDKTFTVYPFATHEDTKENLEKVIEEIKQSRIDSATKANLKAL